MTAHTTDIVVVGSGMAGLTCASRLAAAGRQVVVVDKGRGPGGRLATRRAEALRFDHGAQYATAEGQGFRDYLATLTGTGAAGPWAPQGRTDTRRDWFVGQPGMSGLVRTLTAGLEVRQQAEVVRIGRQGDRWQLDFADGDASLMARRVALTVPAPQAADLLACEPALADELRAVQIAPCWALMVGFGAQLDAPDILHPDGPIAWAARNGSKPGRPAGEAWVFHADPDWSVSFLERSADQARDLLLAEVARLFPAAPDVTHASAHRWRYARTIAPLGRPYAGSDDGTLLVGGDWCLGARVEAAFDSGSALADVWLGKLASLDPASQSVAR